MLLSVLLFWLDLCVLICLYLFFVRIPPRFIRTRCPLFSLLLGVGFISSCPAEWGRIRLQGKCQCSVPAVTSLCVRFQDLRVVTLSPRQYQNQSVFISLAQDAKMHLQGWWDNFHEYWRNKVFFRVSLNMRELPVFGCNWQGIWKKKMWSQFQWRPK